MKNRIKNKTININCRRFYVLLILSILLLFAGACGSKETILLETEELVYEGGEKPEEQGRQEAREDKEEDVTITQEEEQMEESHLFVHICGAVKAPGVYGLAQGSRIFDAVEAAGGFREDASESYVNMALPLQDGWKIVIPTIEEIEVMSTEVYSGNESAAAGITADNAGVQVAENSTDEARNGQVNINTAVSEELCSLPGIGRSRAESIIAYRENNGGFSKPEDIMKVEGIKEGMFSKLKDKICVK